MNSSEQLELLSELVSLNSAYPQESKISLFIADWAHKHGFIVKTQSIGNHRNNLYIYKNKTAPICFYGHLDTVSPTGSWKYPPHQLTSKQNRLYGLGAYDMKAGLVSILSTLISHPNQSKAFFAVDEENISTGAWAAIKKDPNFFTSSDLIISAEPNFFGQPHILTNSRTGRVLFEGQFQGKSAHIADYRQATDALELASNWLHAFYRQRQSLSKDTHTLIQVRQIDSQTSGMSVPEQASIVVEVLLGAQDTIASIQETLSKLSPIQINLKSRPTPYLTGYSFNQFPYRSQLSSIIKQYTKKTLQLAHRSSVGDDNVLATLGTPVLTWGPLGGNAHTQNEFVYKRSFLSLTLMYQDFIKTI